MMKKEGKLLPQVVKARVPHRTKEKKKETFPWGNEFKQTWKCRVTEKRGKRRGDRERERERDVVKTKTRETQKKKERKRQTRQEKKTTNNKGHFGTGETAAEGGPDALVGGRWFAICRRPGEANGDVNLGSPPWVSYRLTEINWRPFIAPADELLRQLLRKQKDPNREKKSEKKN